MLAAPLLALTAAGCADGFEPTLAFAIPEHFEMSKSTKQPAIEHWWTRFGSRELNDLISAADLENLDIAVAVAQLHQAEAQAEIAGAALWPTLDYIDNNTRTQSSGTNQPGVITSPTRRNSFSKTLSASYVLDIWGRNRDALEAALHTASASAYQIEVVRLTALIGVVDNFLIYAASQERVLVAQENFVNARRVLKIIEERKAAGTASDLDVAQQRTLVETTSAPIQLLRQAAETARTQLALLTGRPVQAISLEAKRIQSLKLPTVSPGIPAALLVRRPDIRNAEQQLAAADADVDVARKAFLPTIQLTAQGGFQSALLSTLLRPQSAIYSLAAGLTQPIFDGGRLRGQLKLSLAQRQQLLETYRRTILSALVDVENALIALKEGALREAAQKRAVESARLAFQLSEERLRQGTIDLTTLLGTQNTLFQAQDTLIQIRLARLQAAASLFQALGGDWDVAPAGFVVATPLDRS